MKRIFLSYARLDLRKAARLYQDLSRRGLDVWFDREDLIPGVKWRPAIRKAIREAKYFVAVLSKQSVGRNGFRHSELRQAIEVWGEFPEGKAFLIPVRLENCRMPFRELEEVQYADLFLNWKAGVEKLCTALGARKPSIKPASRQMTRATSVLQYEYRVALADLDVGLTNLPEIARALNETQDFFHFTLSHLELPRKAKVRMTGGDPQLRLDRLPQSFYEERKSIPADYILCFTSRFLAFEEKGRLHINYLGSDSQVDERFSFLSLRGLFHYAGEAKLKFEVALAFLIIGDIVVYFGGLYHDEIRGCPLDWTENHADLVKGLKAGRFCESCRKKLSVNKRLYKALTAMLAWGRK
jgi:hypothetical protein